MPSNKTTKAYEQGYLRLNEQQKRAVDTIEGPVAVIAGPGTGKTQVVAMRTAMILQQTDVHPSNILLLTFSVSGAAAMRNRLRSLIGSDAYRVRIDTIHGFCNSIIQDHPTIFEEWNALQQASDADRVRILHTCIDECMPNLSVVNRKSPYRRSKEILDRISQLKRENKTSEDVQTAADGWQQEVLDATREGTKVRQRELDKVEKLRDVGRLFDLYQKHMASRQLYDFDDMILHVLSVLKAEDWLMAGLQEKYQYIIVDEFQDTNGSQYELLTLLSSQTTIDAEPNMCIVGDDDQAIYRFQGANMQNILSFLERFPEATIVVLDKSYRCSQQILDTAMQVIGNNTERLVGQVDGVQKKLQSMASEGEKPTLVHCASDTAQGAVLVDLVQEIQEAGVPLEDIAILVQTNAELLELHEILRRQQIPVELTGKLDMLKSEKVLQLIAILRAIHQLDQDYLLVPALSCDTFGCHSADIGLLMELARDRHISVSRLLSLWNQEAAQLDTAGFHTPEALKHARDTLWELSQQLPLTTPINTVRDALIATNLLPSAQEQQQQDLIESLAAHAFYRYADRMTKANPSMTCKELLDEIRLYQDPDYGLTLTLDIPHTTERGLQLMTAHQSKGLEFNTVILAKFIDGHWNNRRRRVDISFPEHLLYGWEKDQKQYEAGQDERRVAYVASTRAKRKLYFLAPDQTTQGDRVRDVVPSAFAAEAGETIDEMYRDPRHPEIYLDSLRPVVRELDSEMKTFLKRKVDRFELSATALNHFIEDPWLFVERNLLKWPEAKTPALAYGTAMHAALRVWGDALRQGTSASREQILAAFDEEIHNHALLETERRGLLAEGKDSLQRYLDLQQGRDASVSHVEWFLKGQLDGQDDEVPLRMKGTLDRIDTIVAPHEIAVIDYKTGRPKTEKDIREGNEFRQLAFYAVLLEEAEPSYAARQFSLEYVGDGKEDPIVRTFELSHEERQEMRTLMQDVWRKIQTLDFTPL